MIAGNNKIAESFQDVVILGAGTAGLTAAIAARESGVKVTILEKAPDIKRTNTSRSGGWITRDLPDSNEEIIKKSVELSAGRCDVELVRILTENRDETSRWLEKVGLKFAKVPMHNIPRGGTKQVLGAGAGLNKQLLALAENRGAKIIFSTKGVKLLVNNANEVIGVRALDSHGLRDYMAKSVILATSGFQANQEMLMKYFGPEFAYGARLTGSPYSAGDGHIMAQEVGAKLINMDQSHCRTVDKSWVPRSSGMWGPVRMLQAISHYCIYVNKLGKRFMDEADTSDTVSCGILKQPDAEIAFIFDENIKQIKPEEVENYRPPGIITKADTIEGLANMIGFPCETLIKTIDEYNASIKKGKALGLDVPKRDFVRRIERPPFYAIYPVWAGLNCTWGGAKVTGEMQIVDRDDAPIPGLYASGEMVGGIFVGKYYHTRGGATYYKSNYQITMGGLAVAVITGRLAGYSAAKSIAPKIP